MSDISMFPQHVVLEHHTLETVAFQWDGTEEQAHIITAELAREMPMRDAELFMSKFHATFGARSPVGITLNIGIRRLSDNEEFRNLMVPGEWLIIWLHEGRVYDVIRADAPGGEGMFRRSRPVVVLRRGLT